MNHEPTGITFGAAAARAFEDQDRRRREELDRLIAAGLGDRPARQAAPGAAQEPPPPPPPAAPRKPRQASRRRPKPYERARSFGLLSDLALRRAQDAAARDLRAMLGTEVERSIRLAMTALARELRRRAKE